MTPEQPESDAQPVPADEAQQPMEPSPASPASPVTPADGAPTPATASPDSAGQPSPYSSYPPYPYPGYPAYPQGYPPAYPGYLTYPGYAPMSAPSGATTGQTPTQTSQPVYPLYPYPAYPGYPPAPPGAEPSGAYQAPATPDATPPAQSYPSYYPYPAFPSVPLYPPYPPYGSPASQSMYAPPTTPGSAGAAGRRNALILPITLGAVAVILIVALVSAVLVLGNPHGATGSTQATATDTPFPTVTSIPTATPFPGSVVFSDVVPGVCGDHAEDWDTDTDGTQVSCTNTAMTLTNPTTDKYVSEEFFQPPDYTFPARYEVSVNVSNLTNACGGIAVLRDNYEGYGAYICDDTNWVIEEYGRTGSPTNVSYGGFIRASSYQMSVSVTRSQLVFTLNGDVLYSWTPDITVTIFVGLQVYPRVKGSQATADFDHF